MDKMQFRTDVLRGLNMKGKFEADYTQYGMDLSAVRDFIEELADSFGVRGQLLEDRENIVVFTK